MEDTLIKSCLYYFALLNYNEDNSLGFGFFFWFQDKILEELDKEDSTHDSVSPESDSEEDGIHVDAEKALAEKEKVIEL